MNKEKQNSKIDNGQEIFPYTHCLNCGAELKGKFCHICGQEAVSKTLTIRGFFSEYIGNAYNWDSKFSHTLLNLICRPGRLTNEFLSGKFISQVHPLKLNMFLLFVFVTLFLFFSGTENMTNSVQTVTNDERVLPGYQINYMVEDQAQAKRLQESPRDTVHLLAPLFLAQNYPEYFHCLETKEDTKGEGLDKWVAVIPEVLIKDNIIMKGDNGYYRFNPEANVGTEELEMLYSVWNEMVGITSQYFPIILLLTTPFLSISLRLVQRKSKFPQVGHFIFSLHYTAFLELLMIFIYILYLMIAPSMKVLEYIMIIGSCTYLALAFRKVYAVNNWGKTIVKSLLTSTFYFSILLMIFIIIFLIACFITAANMS